jgi:hypothetical protein
MICIGKKKSPALKTSGRYENNHGKALRFRTGLFFPFTENVRVRHPKTLAAKSKNSGRQKFDSRLTSP